MVVMPIPAESPWDGLESTTMPTRGATKSSIPKAALPSELEAIRSLESASSAYLLRSALPQPALLFLIFAIIFHHEYTAVAIRGQTDKKRNKTTITAAYNAETYAIKATAKTIANIKMRKRNKLVCSPRWETDCRRKSPKRSL